MIQLGRPFGIKVQANWSVFIILALLIFDISAGTGDASILAVAAALAVTFISCLLAHELSHAVVARRFGVQTTDITLWMLGGVARLSTPPPSPRSEFFIAVAGPIMSFALAVVFALLSVAATAVGFANIVISAFLWLALVNVVLAVFNMLPAAPLDGGRVLSSALWALHGDSARAKATAAQVGRVAGVLMILLGVFGMVAGAPTMLWTALLGLFLYNAATMERRVALTRSMFDGLSVADVMVPLAPALRGWATASAALSEAEDPFDMTSLRAVLSWDGPIAGLVTLARCEGWVRSGHGHERVADLFEASVLPSALATENVLDVLARAPRSSSHATLVLDATGAPLGVVTPQSLLQATHAT